MDIKELKALPKALKFEGFELLAEAFCKAETPEELELLSRVGLQYILKKGSVKRG